MNNSTFQTPRLFNNSTTPPTLLSTVEYLNATTLFAFAHANSSTTEGGINSAVKMVNATGDGYVEPVSPIIVASRGANARGFVGEMYDFLGCKSIGNTLDELTLSGETYRIANIGTSSGRILIPRK